MTERVRSTVFRKKIPFSKRQQEEIVATIFAEGYRRERGISLNSGRRVKLDPPDWLFAAAGTTVGVEMFEIEQFHAADAFVSYVTDAIYSEFEQRGLSERYLGTVIAAPLSIQVDTSAKVKRVWQASAVRSQVTAAAREFVDLFTASVPSRDDIPERPPSQLLHTGVMLRVDPETYPVLSVLCKWLIVNRTQDDDPRRSDGKAAPLVILGGGYDFGDDEMQQRIENSLLRKMKDRPRWSVSVDRSILVAHDLPREQMYSVGFAMEWGKWMKRAAARLSVLDAFDEVWLVTFQTLEGKAHLVCRRDR